MKSNLIKFFAVFAVFLCAVSLQAQIVGGLRSGMTADHGEARWPYLLSVDENGYTLDNVRWDLITQDPQNVKVEDLKYEWRTALIRPDMINEIYYIVKPFFPKLLAGHGYMVYTFKPGGFVTCQNETAEGLVISYELFKEPGMALEDIDFVRKGRRDYYPVGSVISSWLPYAMVDCVINDKELIVYKLTLSDEQKRHFLDLSIREAVKDRSQEYYHTLKNSCVTFHVSVLNQLLPENRRIRQYRGKVLNPAGFVPRLIGRAFGRRGLMKRMRSRLDRENFFVPLNYLFSENRINKKGR